MNTQPNHSTKWFLVILPLFALLLWLVVFPNAVAAAVRFSDDMAPYATSVSLAFAIFVLFCKKTEFRRRLDFNSLIKAASSYFRTLAPSAGFSPDELSSNLAPARSLSQFVADNRISLDPVNRDDCAKVFANQLGEQWDGFENASLHIRSLALITVVHAGEGQFGIARGAGLALREDVAIAYATIKDRVARAQKLEMILRPYHDNPELIARFNDVGKQHRYGSTALVSLLMWARKQGGALPSAEFLWLKGVDRTLWYVLNNVGRLEFHMEGAGPMSHFMAESTIGHAMNVPCVDEAVDGLLSRLFAHGIMWRLPRE